MYEKIHTEDGSYSVECFGHFNVQDKECLQCPLRNQCSIKVSHGEREWVVEHEEGEHWVPGPVLVDKKKPHVEYESVCPFCGTTIFAAWKDTGVGYTQDGPFFCTKCQATQIGHVDKKAGKVGKFGYFPPPVRQRISQEQESALRPYLEGKVVHDLGAGDLTLAQYLVNAMEVFHVFAIDRDENSTDNPKIECITSHFKDYTIIDSISVAVMSWPVNWACSLELRAAESDVVVYIGKNTDSSACGDPTLWNHLILRQVLLYMPTFKNDLIIYGPETGERELLPEEKAALDQNKIYNWATLHEKSAVSKPSN